MSDSTVNIPATNKTLLDEVNGAGSWFHAKKSKPLWAKKLDQDEVVPTLEGTERVAAGDYLCRGPAGEVWPQKATRLESKYTATDEVTADGWRRFDPHPEAEGVLAACINQAFTVQATWGRLAGKPGDYLVKDFSDRDVAYPADVWIVEQVIFEATYVRFED